jgi:hypothetical protein
MAPSPSAAESEGLVTRLQRESVIHSDMLR